jgi:GntR family transcriptional regulator
MKSPVRSVVPLYHQIYLILREQFIEGRHGAQPLPSELDLAKKYNVSRVTMRHALEKLVNEGLIYRLRGAGSFVNLDAVKQKTEQRQSAGLFENIIRSALNTTVRLLSLERIAPAPNIAAELELSANERVVKVVRVRSFENEPVSHITTYVPERLGACLQPEALGSKPMLTLLEEHGVKAEHARQIVSARLADSEVASLLDTQVGAPLLAVNRLVRDSHGRPVQLLHGLYRPDRYEYRMDLSRSGDGEARVWYQADGIKTMGHPRS